MKEIKADIVKTSEPYIKNGEFSKDLVVIEKETHIAKKFTVQYNKELYDYEEVKEIDEVGDTITLTKE